MFSHETSYLRCSTLIRLRFEAKLLSTEFFFALLFGLGNLTSYVTIKKLLNFEVLLRGVDKSSLMTKAFEKSLIFYITQLRNSPHKSFIKLFREKSSIYYEHQVPND